VQTPGNRQRNAGTTLVSHCSSRDEEINEVFSRTLRANRTAKVGPEARVHCQKKKGTLPIQPSGASDYSHSNSVGSRASTRTNTPDQGSGTIEGLQEKAISGFQYHLGASYAHTPRQTSRARGPPVPRPVLAQVKSSVTSSQCASQPTHRLDGTFRVEDLQGSCLVVSLNLNNHDLAARYRDMLSSVFSHDSSDSTNTTCHRKNNAIS
jgi:hypothetical protein